MRIYYSFLVFVGFLAYVSAVPVTDAIESSVVVPVEEPNSSIVKSPVEEPVAVVKDVNEQETKQNVFAEAEEILEKIKEIKDAVIGSATLRKEDVLETLVNLENTTEKPTVVKVDEETQKEEKEVQQVVKSDDDTKTKGNEDVVETAKTVVVATDGETVKTENFRTPKEMRKRKRKSNKHGRNNSKNRRTKKTKRRPVVKYVEPMEDEQVDRQKNFGDDEDVYGGDFQSYFQSLEGEPVDVNVGGEEDLDAQYYNGEDSGDYGQYYGPQQEFGFDAQPGFGFPQNPYGNFLNPMQYGYFNRYAMGFPQFQPTGPVEMRRAYDYQPTSEYEVLRLSLGRKLKAYGYL